MLARRGRLVHDDLSEELPLLVPSFSSKGSIHRVGRDGNARFEVAGDLRDFGHMPAKAVLVSAFDLHYGYLSRLYPSPSAKHAERDHLEAEEQHDPIQSLARATLVFLDSGGYELDEGWDSCEPKTAPRAAIAKPSYDIDAYKRIIAALIGDSRMLRLVITSFDHTAKHRNFEDQVSASRELFQAFPDQVHSHIIKPESGATVVEPEAISDKQLDLLRDFHVVGVAEQELGANLKLRLKRVAELRRRMDRLELGAPIHLWGGLDPVITPLYFFAGAQIFDGVSWLRYGFQNGVACSRDSFQVLHPELGVEHDRVFARGARSLKNLGTLVKLEQALREWVDRGGAEFGMFGSEVSVALQRAYGTMKSSIQGV